jgi:membrane associated rhomboid family serine protease
MNRLSIFAVVLAVLAATNPASLDTATSAEQEPALFGFSLGNFFNARKRENVQNYILFTVKTAKLTSSESSFYPDPRVKLGALNNWVDLPPGSGAFFAPRGQSSDAADPVVAILVVNLVIFTCWQLANGGWEVDIMRHHFTASTRNLASGRVWTLLTASLSHADPWHLLMNLVVFEQVSSLVYPQLLDRVEFVTLLLSAGVVASLTSLFVNRGLRGTIVETLGMSGSVYALYSYVAMEFPGRTFTLYNGYAVTAWELMGLNFVMDLVVRRGTDTACHVGGACWGAVYAPAFKYTQVGWWWEQCVIGPFSKMTGHEVARAVFPETMEKRSVILVELAVMVVLTILVWSVWLEMRMPKLPPRRVGDGRRTSTHLGGGWGGLPARSRRD